MAIPNCGLPFKLTGNVKILVKNLRFLCLKIKQFFAIICYQNQQLLLSCFTLVSCLVGLEVYL